MMRVWCLLEMKNRGGKMLFESLKSCMVIWTPKSWLHQIYMPGILFCRYGFDDLGVRVGNHVWIPSIISGSVVVLSAVPSLASGLITTGYYWFLACLSV
ncbi:hypothetical protein Hanom_Chr05g00402031 [Helianthus anomalus]